MKAPVTGWIRITSREPVVIPDATGAGIVETILWKDAAGSHRNK